MKLNEIKINFLGDSITEGVGASGPKNCYVSKVAEYTGATCRNYGISGTRIATQKIPSETPSYDLNFCSRVDGMDTDAEVIIVFGGTNDYGHGDAPLGSMSDRTPDTFYGALHTLYTSLINRFPESMIIVLTPLHREEEGILYNEPRKNGMQATLIEYVNIIREVAEFYSLPILDLYKISGINPQLPILKLKYMLDGLHPTDEGHKILAKKIAAYLKANII